MITNHSPGVWALGLMSLALLPACQPADTGELANPGSAVVMAMPVTTTSAEARSRFLAGMDAFDLARFIDANAEFEQAVAADPTFALGYLQIANSGNSIEAFSENLRKAEANAAGASRAEQLLIEATRKAFDGDLEGQVRVTSELTQVQPESPRAWLALAAAQSAIEEHQAERASIEKAIDLAPNMAAAHIALGNSYLFSEPKDLAQAETQMRRAVELRPDEPNPYDFLGDVHRAQGQLAMARDDYTHAAERAPNDGSPIQQRGHVNSFLGDFAAARADYDQAMKMARANQAPTYAVYRAFVNIHAGNPQAAIDELVALTGSIDTMQVEGATGLKIFALISAAQIALHQRFLDQANTLVSQVTPLLRQLADQVGTEQFRRSQDATIAYFEGWLAAERKNFTLASQKADAITGLVEPDANPRKMEPVHELRGIIALEQGKPADAVGHLRQGNPNDLYITYLLATALDGAGMQDEARKLYADVAGNNFNSVAFALVRKDAVAKAGG